MLWGNVFTGSANETEYQPVAMTAPEEKEDVPGTIHPGEGQPEVERAAMFVPPMESGGRNSDCDNKEEEEL